MNKVDCHFCHKPINPNAEGNYTFVEGWAKNREKGLHSLFRRKELGKWACAGCVKMMKMGVSQDQGSLI